MIIIVCVWKCRLYVLGIMVYTIIVIRTYAFKVISECFQVKIEGKPLIKVKYVLKRSLEYAIVMRRNCY